MAASVAAAESDADKQSRLALDIRNDALGRMGTIHTMISLLGRHPGSLVSLRWRDASRGLALRGSEERSIVRAALADHTNPHLLANFGYYV